jgi:hypothetical protein
VNAENSSHALLSEGLESISPECRSNSLGLKVKAADSPGITRQLLVSDVHCQCRE